MVMAEAPESVTWGYLTSAAANVRFAGRRVLMPTLQQQEPRLGQGEETDRLSRVGLTAIRWSGADGGIRRAGGIGSWKQQLNVIGYNEGIQTRLPGLGILPCALTNQASFIAADFSGAVAANQRLHSANTALGSSGPLWVGAIGARIIRATSLTDAALTVPATSDAVTDLVLSMAELVANNTAYLAISTDGVADDTKGTVDPTAATVAWVELVTHAHADDGFWGMVYLPGVGEGWTILAGRHNNVAGIYAFPKDAALPLTTSTLTPVVYTATKDIEGNIATVTTAQTSPTAGSTDVGSGTNGVTVPAAGDRRWTSPANILSSDNAYATTGGGTNWEDDGVSDNLIAHGYDFSAVPRAAVISGIAIPIEAKEAAAGNNMGFHTVELLVGGSKVGNNMADGTELTATDAVYTFGGSTSRFGAGKLTGADIQYALGVRIAVGIVGATTGTSCTVSIDHVPITLTYRMPGTLATLNEGGFTQGKPPFSDTEFAYCEPYPSGEQTTVLKPRRLILCTVAHDASGDRPTIAVTPLNTGLSHIHHYAHYQGGYAFTGADSVGMGTHVKFLSQAGAGSLINFNLPTEWGGNKVRCNALFPRGEWLLGEMVFLNSSDVVVDRQWWFYRDGKWFADTLVQSKSNTAIALQPLAWAEAALNLNSKRIYSLYPVSTTALAAARTYIAEDLGADPRLTPESVSEVKSMGFTGGTEDTALRLTMAEIEAGPPEANMALLEINAHMRQISAATGAAYGSVTFDGVTDGDSAFASPEITREFTAAFEQYDALSAGVSYRTLLTRFGLKHDAGSAETPNAFPILGYTVQQWEHLDVYEFYVEPDSMKPNPVDFLADLYTLANTKPVQPLRFGNVNVPAVFLGASPPPAVLAARGRAFSGVDYSDERRGQELIKLSFRKTLGSVSTS